MHIADTEKARIWRQRSSLWGGSNWQGGKQIAMAYNADDLHNSA